jgi:hypothetical protein
MDNIDPMSDGRRGRRPFDFVPQTENGVSERLRIKLCERRRAARHHGLLIMRLLVADPGDLPALVRFTMEG